MKFPNMVYRSPGTHQCPGGTYDYLSVKNEQALEAAAKAGWFPTVDLALEAPEAFDWGEYLGYAPEPDAELPSRADLEMRATLLGLEFTNRMQDATLAKRIAKAEAGEQ